MSVSPVPSTSFSFYPDINFEEAQEAPPNAENEEETANQPCSLKDRLSSIIDCIGYKTYSAWVNLPLTMPIELAEAEHKRTIKEVFAVKPKPFQEIKQTVLAYPDHLCSWSWGHKLERENVELYSDPEFRKAKAKEYLERLWAKTREENEEQWLVLTFCQQELQDLYRTEPKYLDSRDIDLWMLNGHNRATLAKHRREWDKLTPSEKAEKIFGKRDKYEIIAAATTAVSCFFLCHSIYQQWSSFR